MTEYEALEGAEAALEQYRAEMEDNYLASTDDDFVGVQCYTTHLFGLNGLVSGAEGELTEMGYLYWPQSGAYTLRRATELTTAPPRGDRERHRDSRRRPTHPLPRQHSATSTKPAATAPTCAVTSSGPRDDPKFGLVAVDRSTFARRPKASATWYAAAVVARSGR